MPSYFNVLECGGKLLDRLGVSYKRACMATAKEEYYTNILDSLLDHNYPHKKLQEAVIRVMEETEYEEKYSKRNANNVTMDNFIQSPITINTQKKDANMSNERRIASDIHA